MRIIPLVLTLLFAAAVTPRVAFAGDANRVTVTAILVIASNEAGPSDRRLSAYEANLKRTLRYESFRYVGEGSATVPAGGGNATIALPNGNRLELEGERGGRVKVIYGSTSVVISGRNTVVVAGRSTGKEGEISAVIVMAN